jgi:SAM-dependent methyltransferase/uncharacterized protein YbaR (Trm112 family)
MTKELTNTATFDRAKIYERLDVLPEPVGYHGKIPWRVQCQIAATNGIHYVDAIGKMTQYPIPSIPVPMAERPNELLLDIGCGWGRWVTAAGQKNYIPVGIDIRLEFCQTAREVMRHHGISGYTVVADLQNLPFKDNVFDAAWSFSVIQHTHRKRLESCLRHLYRICHTDGFCKLEFPNKNGIRNRLGPVRASEAEKDDFNSWCVRYYTIAEYQALFESIFHNFHFENHSFLGIGVLPEDLKFAPGFKNKAISAISLFFSSLAKAIPPMKYFSDSIYVEVSKKKVGGEENDDILADFIGQHRQNPFHNLNIIPLLACPLTGGTLVLSPDKKWLISEKAGRKFPIVNDTPVLTSFEGISL